MAEAAGDGPETGTLSATEVFSRPLLRLRYELKRASKDGTRAIILSPLDLCARVGALIPRPGFHRVRYYGCLSSHSSLRREVVPEPAAAVDNPLDADLDQLALGFEAFDAGRARQNSGNRRPWAWLLRHVWQVDVSTCARCGGPMKWVEVATESDAIRRVLAELGHEHGHDGSGVAEVRLIGRFWADAVARLATSLPR